MNKKQQKKEERKKRKILSSNAQFLPFLLKPPAGICIYNVTMLQRLVAKVSRTVSMAIFIFFLSFCISHPEREAYFKSRRSNGIFSFRLGLL